MSSQTLSAALTSSTVQMLQTARRPPPTSSRGARQAGSHNISRRPEKSPPARANARPAASLIKDRRQSPRRISRRLPSAPFVSGMQLLIPGAAAAAATRPGRGSVPARFGPAVISRRPVSGSANTPRSAAAPCGLYARRRSAPQVARSAPRRARVIVYLTRRRPV